MSIASTLERLHRQAKENSWLRLFSIFCRLVLALGFIPAGIVKITDERFASGLSVKHPMGGYLEALHQTGYYYTFIGVAQLAAAVMLLIPRAAALGAFLYFPIILNICVLTFALRFDGSLFTAPLMTLANLYLLAWHYEKWKYVLPFNHLAHDEAERKSVEIDPETERSATARAAFSRYGLRPLYARFRRFFKRLRADKFPFGFFAGVFAAVVFFVVFVPNLLYRVKPRNTPAQCRRQFDGGGRRTAGENFCNCIHRDGEPLGTCLNRYNQDPDDAVGESAPTAFAEEDRRRFGNFNFAVLTTGKFL